MAKSHLTVDVHERKQGFLTEKEIEKLLDGAKQNRHGFRDWPSTHETVKMVLRGHI